MTQIGQILNNNVNTEIMEAEIKKQIEETNRQIEHQMYVIKIMENKLSNFKRELEESKLLIAYHLIKS